MRLCRPSRSFLLAGLVLMAVGPAMAQSETPVPDTLNRRDEQGRKQGWWQWKAPQEDSLGYAAGSLVEQGRYKHNKRTGTWTRYWPGGKIRSKVLYSMGMPMGAYAFYYKNGQVAEQGTWDLDRNTGDFKRWHPNGNLAQAFHFNAYGLRDGEQKYFHENGELALAVTISDGREEGLLKRYHESGELQETAMFAAGVAEKASFRTYAAKEPMAQAPPANAAPAPARTAKETTNASLFKVNGPNTLYDVQHRLTQQGHYRKGRLWNGKVYRYDGNGILYKIEVYQEGRYIGNAQLTEDDR